VEWLLQGICLVLEACSNLGNLEEHFLGVMMRAGATSPQFWMPLISTFTIFLTILIIQSYSQVVINQINPYIFLEMV